MISQKELTEKISLTQKRLDKLNEKLKSDPELQDKPIDKDFDPKWTYGHYLSTLVSCLRALKECNGE